MAHSANVSSQQVERFREYLCLLARAHLRPGHPRGIKASDVVQQTLLVAHQQLGKFRGQSDAQLAAWLKQMLANNLTDALRARHTAKRDMRGQRSLQAEIDDSFLRGDGWLAASQTSPSQLAVRVEQTLQLASRLADLRPDQREAIVLHHLQGRLLAQLAAHLQRSKSAVAGLLHRGLKNYAT